LYWYRISVQESETRAIRTDAPHGDAAIQVDSSITQVGQFINSDAFYEGGEKPFPFRNYGLLEVLGATSASAACEQD
ncbi:MAG: hypothetical protein ABIJ96_02155, partial [Elusimicrobiota bacterium]